MSICRIEVVRARKAHRCLDCRAVTIQRGERHVCVTLSPGTEFNPFPTWSTGRFCADHGRRLVAPERRAELAP